MVKGKIDPIIDGKTGFLFLDENNLPKTRIHWYNYLKEIRRSYNNSHKEKLPPVTPHTCRHTFCSKIVQDGMNLKSVQYIMGHSSVKLTLDVYTHTNIENVKRDFFKVCGG